MPLVYVTAGAFPAWADVTLTSGDTLRVFGGSQGSQVVLWRGNQYLIESPGLEQIL